jgi:hypothetical protein
VSVFSTGGESRPQPEDRLSIVAVSALVAAAALAGLLLGGVFQSDPAPVQPPPKATQITEAGVRLQLPSGWAQGDVASFPGFHQALWVHHSGDNLRAAVELLPAASPTLLPAPLLASLEGAPNSPDTVRVGSGHEALRYRIPRPDGSQWVLYAAPTTMGIATIACLSAVDVGIPRGCEALAAGVAVPGGRALAPGKSAGFFSRLPRTATDLASARAKGVRDLDAARRSADQALAADGLARAHKAAGSSLAPLTRRGDGLPTATVGALTATATAYAALASAARDRSPRPYAEASRAVAGADADLTRTLTNVAAATRAAGGAVAPAASAPVRKPAAPAASAPARKPATPAVQAPVRTPAAPAASTPARKPAAPAAKAPARKPGNWPTSVPAPKLDAPAASATTRNSGNRSTSARARKPAAPGGKAPARKPGNWPTSVPAPKLDAAASAPARSPGRRSTNASARKPAAPAAKAPARKPGKWPSSASRESDDPAATEPLSDVAAVATPAATASSGSNLMLPLLAMLGALAIVLGWRARRS